MLSVVRRAASLAQPPQEQVAGFHCAFDGQGSGKHPASVKPTVDDPDPDPDPPATPGGETACEKQSMSPVFGSCWQQRSGCGTPPGPMGAAHAAGHAPHPVNGGTGTGSAGQLHGGQGPLAGQAHAHPDGGGPRTSQLMLVPSLVQQVVPP